jgi:hypothetical protein
VFDSACSFRTYANLDSLAALGESEQECAEIRPDVGRIRSFLARMSARRVEIRVVSNAAKTASADCPNHIGSEVLQDGTHVRIGDNGRQDEPDLVNEGA